MLKTARKKNKGLGIEFILGDSEKRLPFEDDSFDFVAASYVAHGMKEDERKRLYKEMKRVARYLVVFHDYNDKKRIGTSIIEWLERGDYFNFIKSVPDDFKSVFSEVKVIDINENAAWYVCKVE